MKSDNLKDRKIPELFIFFYHQLALTYSVRVNSKLALTPSSSAVCQSLWLFTSHFTFSFTQHTLIVQILLMLLCWALGNILGPLFPIVMALELSHRLPCKSP